MKTDKIFEESGNMFTRIFSTDKVEKVNPIEYYKKLEVETAATLLRDVLGAKNPFLASQLEDNFFVREAEKILTDHFQEGEQTKIHSNFIELLKTNRKKDQEKLLKGMTLNPTELMFLIFISYKDFGFLYSKYLFENLPNGLEGRKLPEIFNITENGSIEKVGETDLTDGELKNVIEHRKVIVSHFFEKDDFWHCFFLTYNSIGGKENWKNGQPHFHYISSAFGILKEDFVESMRTGKYKSTPIHIDLLEYGKQPKD